MRVTAEVCPEASAAFLSILLTHLRPGPKGCAELPQPTNKTHYKNKLFILQPSTQGKPDAGVGTLPRLAL